MYNLVNVDKKHLKKCDGIVLFSSKMIAEVTKKRHDNVMRDILVIINELGKQSMVGLEIDLDSYFFDVKKTKGKRVTTKEIWMNEKAIQLILTGYDVRRRAQVLDYIDKLQEKYSALKGKYLHSIKTGGKETITSKELLQTELFRHDWWQTLSIKSLGSRFKESARLTVFLQSIGISSVSHYKGKVHKTKLFSKRDVFNKVSAFLKENSDDDQACMDAISIFQNELQLAAA